MYKEMFVEYLLPGNPIKQSERMSWEAFCDFCTWWGVEILFCCATDDPRVNVE